MTDIEMLKWREKQARAQADAEVAERFCTRAAEVREEVDFLLASGLNEGAEQALTAFAEEDMVDFSIMVDLAADIAINNVEPLSENTRLHLEEFLDQEPWHSLAIDLDVTVVLAMIEDVLQHSGRWYESSPRLPVTLAILMDRVNPEQFRRFEAEWLTRTARYPSPDPGNIALISEFILGGARRLGVKPASH